MFLCQPLSITTITLQPQPRTDTAKLLLGLAAWCSPGSPPTTATTQQEGQADGTTDATRNTTKRRRRTIVLPTRTYTTMQPRRLPHINAKCPVCNQEFVGREWRVRAIHNCGKSWHPLCFATTWPTIPVQTDPNTPDDVKQLIQGTKTAATPAAAPPPAPAGATQQAHTTEGDPHNTSRPTNHLTDMQFPSLADFNNISWDDIPTYTHGQSHTTTMPRAVHPTTQKHLRLHHTTHREQRPTRGQQWLEATSGHTTHDSQQHRTTPSRPQKARTCL